MDISWPGVIVGPLLVIVCVLAYIKRDSLSKFANSASGTFIGNKAAKKYMTDPEHTKAALILPIFGGIALGFAIFILSITGVMA